MRQRESVPVPRGWTGGAAWKGAGTSLLLHLFAGAAVIVALSGPPKAPPRVVDLTLLPPADFGRRPVAHIFAAAAEQDRDDGPAGLAEPHALSASPAAGNPPAVPAQASLPDPAVKRSPSAPESPFALAAAPVPTGQAPVKTTMGGPPDPWSAGTSGAAKSGAGTPGAGTSRVGISGAGPPAGDFVWIRDAIQRAIAYPPAARRMGWEGKVVVAFQLLSDGSVRDVRVVQGSGHIALDRGAIDAVRNASPFHRSPIEAEVITPVVYRLTTR